MTDPLHTEPGVEVMPEDYDRSHDAWVRLAQEYGVGNLVPPWFDQAFARHRTAAEAASRAEVEALREALAKARKIIRDVEDYMARPDRGDWGTECALCMGELFDDDREAIAAIDAALTASDGGE